MITGIYDFTGTGLYIHVPFCQTKCSYCGFYSTTPNETLVEQYLIQLEKEAHKRIQESGSEIHTIFVGGGNPMCLGVEGLKKLVKIVLADIPAEKIKEWSFEANPESMSEEIATVLADVPAVRISMGVQRLRDEELQILGRQARMAHVHQAMEICSGRFDNLGADFILGVPGCGSIAQDLSSFLEKYPLQHISAYFLSVEPGSALEKRIESGEFAHPDDCGPEELFAVKEALIHKGFEHYEISNYSLPGKRCLHNMNYWKPGNYIGLGPSAVSTIGPLRKYNPANVTHWLSDEQQVLEQLSPLDRRNEYLMLRLRLINDGLNIASLERRFGEQDEKFYLELEWHIEQGNLERSGSIIRLTNKGITYADNIMASLFV